VRFEHPPGASTPQEVWGVLKRHGLIAAADHAGKDPGSEESMYHHVKSSHVPVRVVRDGSTLGNMLLEQSAGSNGELAAAMRL